LVALFAGLASLPVGDALPGDAQEPGLDHRLLAAPQGVDGLDGRDEDLLGNLVGRVGLAQPCQRIATDGAVEAVEEPVPAPPLALGSRVDGVEYPVAVEATGVGEFELSLDRRVARRLPGHHPSRIPRPLSSDVQRPVILADVRGC